LSVHRFLRYPMSNHRLWWHVRAALDGLRVMCGSHCSREKKITHLGMYIFVWMLT
jgi:hypothetical protein